MKKLKCLGVAAMATVLLTSCLKGGENSRTVSSYGVIDFSIDAMANVAYVDDYTQCYAPQFSDLSEGDCVIFTGTLNYDDPVNDGSKKYLTISNAIVNSKLEKSKDFSGVLDTANIMSSEMMTLNAEMLVGTDYSFTIKNYFFIGSTHEKAPTDQNNKYIMQYDPNQEPKEEGGKRIYDFFLRVVKVSDGKGVPGTNNFYYTFNTLGHFKSLQSKETAAGNNSVNIRINYLNSYDEATNTKKWGKSPVYTIKILKES